MAGLLDLATNNPARFSQSGMPDAVRPLRPLTAAEASLRTHAVTDVTPTSVRDDPPRQTLRTDLLKSGYVPGSEGDKLFVAAHGGMNVWDDPSMSHADNERLFRATNVRRQRPRSSTPESFTGNLTETEEHELADRFLRLCRVPRPHSRRGRGRTGAGHRRMRRDAPRGARRHRGRGRRALRRDGARGASSGGCERVSHSRSGPEGAAPEPRGARS